MRKLAAVTAVLLGLAGAWTRCSAQDDAPPADVALRSSAELDQLLGPIALYPDPLIGILLPAASDPTEIVMADRYLNEGGDPNAVDQQPWDPSVQALAHYPTVLKWMDDNIQWTTELGQAFAAQQSDVMDSIQRLRAQAQALGNLQTTAQESVVADDGAIDIDPVDPDEMYVPTYQPDLIYSQPGIYCTFGLGLPIGLWLGFDWDWHHHHLIWWGHDHPRPHDWWRLPPAQRHREMPSHNANVWRAHNAPVAARGGDRGYAPAVQRRPSAVARPRVPVGHIETGHAEAGRTAPVTRGAEPPRTRAVEPRAPVVTRPAPEISRPVERRAPSEGVFGGSQSVRQIENSSSRGEMSRGEVSAPSRGGGGAGGGNRRR